jgi:hypothetical protein
MWGVFVFAHDDLFTRAVGLRRGPSRCKESGQGKVEKKS